MKNVYAYKLSYGVMYSLCCQWKDIEVLRRVAAYWEPFFVNAVFCRVTVYEE